MQATGILCIKGRLFVVSFTTSELSQKLRFTQSFCFFEISETDCTTLKIHPSISRNTANVYQITHAMTGSMRFDSFIHLFLAAKQTSCMFLSLFMKSYNNFFSNSAGILLRRVSAQASSSRSSVTTHTELQSLGWLGNTLPYSTTYLQIL